MRKDQARCVSCPSQCGRAPASSDGAVPKCEDEASNTANPGESVDTDSHWTDSVDSRYEDSFRSASAPGL